MITFPIQQLYLLLLCAISTTYCAESVHFETSKLDYRADYAIKAFASNDTTSFAYCLASTAEPFDAWLPDFREEYLGQILYNTTLRNKQAKIYKLEIEKPHQRKGLGTELFLQALDNMQTEKVERIRWQSTWNALPFYKRFGVRRAPEDTLSMEFVLLKTAIHAII